MHAVRALIVLGFVATSACMHDVASKPSASPSSPSPSTSAADPVIAAAGDIACNPRIAGWNGGRGTASDCRQKATSALLARGRYDAILPLGDEQYELGALHDFRLGYGPTWGMFKAISHPVPGNHEYGSATARGYFDYFRSRAGGRSKGYYSYDIGSWHMIALNSNCGGAGGCGAVSPQLQWLVADLRAHRNRCTLAYWHHPRFSSGLHGDDESTAPFWRALYTGGADVVLNGHDHDYERFAPQTPAGKADTKHGIREFVVGTGGRNLYPFLFVRPNSEERH
ncbi:MAG: metallophosphoesterase, partial [Actinobacteria bacterium]|nr:metallophosphoesterase [Actinomycetota bacterium]